MAVPDAPQSGDGQPLLFGMWDDAGTNRAVILRGNFQVTMNGEDAGELRVYPTSGYAEVGWHTLAATTAESLALGGGSGYECAGMLIKAPLSNGGPVYLSRSSSLTADDDPSTGGYPLEPGESIGWPCRNAKVFLRGLVGDRVAVVASVDG